ncbi:hypothetical protein I5G87_gp36 [Mycobacterium phage Ekdilam]|uniref:Uncharacterized protein n=1 Tax=Mycobacterium phage Ekdilam TaxID=2599862 RepID=A0A5J6TL46_9CAUD|nr:hypothetical protein I5G87_gp36 [Mycobacterium phage Ekdilam]QFG11460.1 hypothetical protein PBI_EKDILAM_36 [Mycobacterium phage Ekdilam]
MSARSEVLPRFTIDVGELVAEARAAAAAERLRLDAEQHTVSAPCPRQAGGCGAARGERCARGCRRAAA